MMLHRKSFFFFFCPHVTMLCVYGCLFLKGWVVSWHTFAVLLNWLYCTCNWKHLFLGKSMLSFSLPTISLNKLFVFCVIGSQGLFSFQIEPKMSTGRFGIWNRRTDANTEEHLNKFLFSFKSNKLFVFGTCFYAFVSCDDYFFFPIVPLVVKAEGRFDIWMEILYIKQRTKWRWNVNWGFVYMYTEKQTLRSFSRYSSSSSSSSCPL